MKKAKLSFSLRPKVILYIATTLDGYIASPDGSIDWLKHYEGGKEDYGYARFYASVGSILIGHTTYRQALTFGAYPYAGKKCFVFTKNKMKKNDSHAQFVRSPVASFTKKLVQTEQKNIWLVGGSTLIHAFLEENLIDEFIITYIPLLLGKGIPLFKKNNSKVSLALKSVTPFDNGIVQATYVRQK